MVVQNCETGDDSKDGDTVLKAETNGGKLYCGSQAFKRALGRKIKNKKKIKNICGPNVRISFTSS